MLRLPFSRCHPSIHAQTFGAMNALYRKSVKSLELSLFYRDRATTELKVAVSGSEGPFAFPIIEPGVEDYVAIQTLTVQERLAQLLPRKAIAAMLMVDFWCVPSSPTEITLAHSKIGTLFTLLAARA